MNFGYRDWRVIASFCGLPGLRAARELRQALLLQMTPTELETYQQHRHWLITVMLILAVGLALIAPPPRLWLAWFLVYVLYTLRYWHIDPITVATKEYNRYLEAIVRQECETARQQRIDAGL